VILKSYLGKPNAVKRQGVPYNMALIPTALSFGIIDGAAA
jgi:hypothetical protein